MPKDVTVDGYPDLSLSFPDEATDEQIEAYVDKHYPPLPEEAAGEEETAPPTFGNYAAGDSAYNNREDGPDPVSWPEVGVRALKAAPAFAGQSIGGLVQALGEAWGLDRVADEGRWLADGSRMEIEELREGIPVDSDKELAFDAIGGTAEFAPALAASIAIANPAPAMAYAGISSAGKTYDIDRNANGVDQEMAGMRAAGFGALDAALAYIPIHYFIKPGDSLIKKSVRGGIGNVGTAFLSELVKLEVDQGTVNPDMPFIEYYHRLKKSTLMGLVTTPVTAGLAHTMGAGIGRAFPSTRPPKFTAPSLWNDGSVVTETNVTAHEAAVKLPPKQPPVTTDSFFRGLHAKLKELEGRIADGQLTAEEGFEIDEVTAFLKKPTEAGAEKLAKAYGIELEDLGLEALMRREGAEVNEPMYVTMTEADIAEMTANHDSAYYNPDKNYQMKNFNHEKFQTGGDVKMYIDGAVSRRQAEEAVGNKTLPKTKEEAAAHIEKLRTDGDGIARKLGYDSLKDLRLLSGNLKTAVYQLQAWYDILASSGRRMVKLKRAAMSEGATDLDKVKYVTHEAFHGEMAALLMSGKADASRILGSHRLTHNGFGVPWENITAEMAAASPEIQAKIAEMKAGGLDKHIEARRGEVDDNLAAMNKQSRTIPGSKLGNFLLDMSNKNLLSSMNTQKVNFISNLIRLLDSPAMAYTEAAVNVLHPNHEPTRVSFNEANARTLATGTAVMEAFLYKPVKGSVTKLGKTGQAVADAIVKDPQVLVRGKTYVDLLQEAIDVPENVRDYFIEESLRFGQDKTTDLAGGLNRPNIMSSEYLRTNGLAAAIDGNLPALGQKLFWKSVDVGGALYGLPSYTFMAAVDAPFKYVNFSGQRAALVYRETAAFAEANHGKMSGPEMSKAKAAFSKKLTKDVMMFNEGLPIKGDVEYLATVERIHTSAIHEAQAGVWQGKLEGIVGQTSTLLNNSPVLRQATGMRFFKTPAKLLSYATEMTPGLNLMKKGMYHDLIGDHGVTRQNRAIARNILGTLLWTSCLSIAKQGLITGSHTREERNALTAAGIPEHSYWDGDKWIEYDRLDPSSFPLTIAANYVKMERYIDSGMNDRVAEMAVLLFANSVLMKTYLHGPAQVVEAISSPERGLKTLMLSLASAYMPLSGLFKNENNSLREHMKETSSVMDLLMNTYTEEGGRNKLDWRGKPVENHPRLLGNKTDTPEWDSPALWEVAKLGMSIQKMSRKYGKYEMTDEEYHEVRRSLDTQWRMDEWLSAMITNPEFQAITNRKVRKEIIGDFISKTRKNAVEYYFMTDEERSKVAIDQKMIEASEYLLHDVSKFDRGNPDWNILSNPPAYTTGEEARELLQQ